MVSKKKQIKIIRVIKISQINLNSGVLGSLLISILKKDEMMEGNKDGLQNILTEYLNLDCIQIGIRLKLKI
jgi:hypothetical protein